MMCLLAQPKQALRGKREAKAIEYIASHEGVWLTTSDEIADHYVGSQNRRSRGDG